MIKKIAYILMPIKREEIGKCFSMGIMFFFILFNYDLLRSMKDSLIVPTIGPEVVGFVKMYTITPAALSFMLFYTYISERLPFEKIFYLISAAFLLFFLAFAFIIYPNQNFFHPSAESIEILIKHKKAFWNIDMEHFKWFLRMYGKWSFVLFYIFAELWGSAMIFMLFWQFANHTTTTEEAKRLYPVFSFIGHTGAVSAGVVVGYLSSSFFGVNFIVACMLTASFCTIATIVLFSYNKRSIWHKNIHHTVPKKAEEYKHKLSVFESLKIVLSSKYLALIIVLVISCGTCINLIEGVWRDKAVQFYKDTTTYANFMSEIVKITGGLAMLGMLMSGPLLRVLGWLFGALALPLTMLVTGVIFFLLAIFGRHLSPYVGVNILFLTVIVGSIQNILTRAVKYSFFDITKELTYIPADDHIRSKGKAAVDIVGSRWAKSIGSLIQSTLFIIFPMATFDTLAPYLMAIFIGIVIFWLWGVKALYAVYTQKIKSREA